MRGSSGTVPLITAQSSSGITAVLPRRRVSRSPAPSRSALASPAPAPTLGRRLPAPCPAGALPERAAEGPRGVPGVPPWERAPLTQARPRVSQAPSRSARRTSSSAGTSGASPPSGNVTRTTTARITATRRIAVSVRPLARGRGEPGREPRTGPSPRRAWKGRARFPAALRCAAPRFMNE